MTTLKTPLVWRIFGFDTIEDTANVIKDYQIANDCTEEEAIDALVDKIMEITQCK